jgi:hypothetical protein
MAQTATRPLRNEEGFVLVISIIILMLLTVIGISITTTTSIELQIAGNEKIQKATFTQADGGTEVAAELIEQNLGCMSGFSTQYIGDNAATQIFVDNLTFWKNLDADIPNPYNSSDPNYPDFYFPATAPIVATANDQRVDIRVGGSTTLSTGAAIQMVAGYEGKGKGAGGGGGYILYDVFSRAQGVKNSESIIRMQWRHIIGTEGSCNY